MPIKVSEFQPKVVEFKIWGSDGTLLETDQDYWLRLIPPSFRADRERGQFLKYALSNSGLTSVSNPRVREALEIWLTFGGTNLEVEVPKLDDEGAVMFRENDDGEMVMKTEVIAFPDKRDGISRQDFMDKIDQLPEYIVNSWHAHVIREVAPSWQTPF